MKKVLIVALTIVIGLFYTLTATAETIIYLDHTVDGIIQYNIDNQKWNSVMDAIGIELISERFKLGGEIHFGSCETASKTDINTYQLTGGFRLINGERFKLDADLTYQSNTLKSNDSQNYTGFMFGGNMMIGSEKSHVDLLLWLPVSGSTDVQGIKDIRLLNTQLKYNYLLSDNISFSIGYRYSSIIWTWDDPVFYKGITYTGGDFSNYGATIGFIYKL